MYMLIKINISICMYTKVIFKRLYLINGMDNGLEDGMVYGMDYGMEHWESKFIVLDALLLLAL